MSGHTTHQHPADWDEPVAIPEIGSDVSSILVPFDGSAGSERGLAYAELVARVTNAEIAVLVAFDPPVTVRRRGILLVEQARAELEEDARELATEAAEALIERGSRARGIVVRGDPVQAILEAIETDEPDLVVIGRRGLTTFEGVMLGSVSMRVASHAQVPVLLV
jgi:nucleotide-binding universal stress UspA family protein